MERPIEIHLTEIIAQFYEIAKERYNGKVYDNVLNIFDEMDLESQKTLLRGTLGVYAATTSTLIHERDVIDNGNIDALLGYLKRARSQPRVIDSIYDSRFLSQDEDDKTSSSDKESNDLLKSPFIRGLAMLIIVGVVLHLGILAMSDNPDTIQNAKFYSTILSIVTMFTK